jgi:hypothetical protein
MNRFPHEVLFGHVAAAGRLDLALMPPLAVAIAECRALAQHTVTGTGHSPVERADDDELESMRQ